MSDGPGPLTDLARLNGQRGIVRAVLAGLDVEVCRPAHDTTQLSVTVASETGHASAAVPVDVLADLDRYATAMIVDELADTAVEMLLEAATESVREP